MEKLDIVTGSRIIAVENGFSAGGRGMRLVFNLMTQVSGSPSHRGPRMNGILGIGGNISEE